jgi:hypothetical protein
MLAEVSSLFVVLPVPVPGMMANMWYVVFGNVTAGMDFLKAMGYVGSTKCKGKPLAKVMIVNCGQLCVLKPFVDRVLESVTNTNNREVVKSIKADYVTSNPESFSTQREKAQTNWLSQ